MLKFAPSHRHRFALTSLPALALAAAAVVLSACAPSPQSGPIPTSTPGPVIGTATGERQAIDLSDRDFATPTAPSPTPAAASLAPRIPIIPRDRNEARIGATQHPLILQTFGGEVTNPKLSAYITDIGQRIVARSEQPNAPWTFTVLDSDQINAFAVPGGYIYVTRGLIALADDEAELAAVIGHEIGHVTAKHSARQRDLQREQTLNVLGATLLGGLLGGPAGAGLAQQVGSTIGAGNAAGYSREQEFEADDYGVTYLARVGYDPSAQADFLNSMQEHARLEASLAGRQFDPTRVGFLATHPASADREQRARALAGRTGSTSGARERARFLDAIDGMIYGPGAELGFVEGTVFYVPAKRIAVDLGRPLEIKVEPGKMSGESELLNMVLELEPDGPTDPGLWLADGYVAAFFNRFGDGPTPTIRRMRINGLPAAMTEFAGVIEGDNVHVTIAAMRHLGNMWRLVTITPRERPQREAILTMIRSFRGLSAAEAGDLVPGRLMIHTVGRGETVSDVAGMMDVDSAPLERFRVLNSLGPNDRLSQGERVKIVVR
ncbi:MAG: M48 family metalloprotease [Pseudomonadota bacterium]